MASKRWDLTVSHKSKDGKWRSQKVGVVFEGDKGQLQVRLDPGIAIYQTENVMVTAWLPKERDGAGPRGGGGFSGGGQDDGYGPDGSDDVPF